MSARENTGAIEIPKCAVCSHGLRIPGLATQIGALSLTTAHMAANMRFGDVADFFHRNDVKQTAKAFTERIINMAKALGLVSPPVGFQIKIGKVLSAYQFVAFTQDMFENLDTTDRDLVRLGHGCGHAG